MHLNCSSIAKNGIDLSSYLAHLNLKFDIIMLTETRQTTVGIVEFYFPNYDIFLDNPDSSKGGACVLVRKNMFQNVKLVLDNSTNLKNKCNCAHCEIENVWVSLEFNKKQVLIGCIYRHPKAESGISHFNEYFNTALNSINDNIITIIAGDFNINLLNTENALVEQYTNNALQNSFIPCITIPTRVTYHSASIIDHILLKTPKHLIHTKVSAGNLVTDISDHLPNLLFIDLLVQTPKYRPMVRLFTPNRVNEYLNNEFNEKPLITYTNDINVKDNTPQPTFSEFNENISELLNKYFPLIKQSRKQFKDKPFITNGIKESIKSRNTLYKTYLNYPSEINESNWKNKRNRVVDIIRKVESDYYASALKIMLTQTNSYGKLLVVYLTNKKQQYLDRPNLSKNQRNSRPTRNNKKKSIALVRNLLMS